MLRTDPCSQSLWENSHARLPTSSGCLTWLQLWLTAITHSSPRTTFRRPKLDSKTSTVLWLITQMASSTTCLNRSQRRAEATRSWLILCNDNSRSFSCFRSKLRRSKLLCRHRETWLLSSSKTRTRMLSKQTLSLCSKMPIFSQASSVKTSSQDSIRWLKLKRRKRRATRFREVLAEKSAIQCLQAEVIKTLSTKLCCQQLSLLSTVTSSVKNEMLLRAMVCQTKSLRLMKTKLMSRCMSERRCEIMWSEIDKLW